MIDTKFDRAFDKFVSLFFLTLTIVTACETMRVIQQINQVIH